MNLIELNRALRQLRLGGMAAVLETRLHAWVLQRAGAFSIHREGMDREALKAAIQILVQAQRPLILFPEGIVTRTNDRLGTLQEGAAFIARREDALFLGPPGSGKSHLAQAIGAAAIQQGYRVLYREAHTLLEELSEATLEGTRKQVVDWLATVPLLIIDDLGMRKLPQTAAEELLEIIMRRYERASTLVTSNRPVEDWGKLLGDSAAVTAMLDRLLHHGHVLKCGPRSWRTKMDLPQQEAAG